MTLAIGMIPSREPGAVLVVDTIGMFLDADGRRIRDRDERKLLWVHGSRLAVAISGAVNDAGLTSLGLTSDYNLNGSAGPDTHECVRKLFRGLLAVNADVKLRHQDDSEPLELDLPDPSPHVLFAGGVEGEPPELARLTPLTERWAQPGMTLSIGSWLIDMPADIAEEMSGPTPSSLDGCLMLAADWVRRRLYALVGDRAYDEIEQELGGQPTFGFPLRALLLTPDRCTLHEITQGGFD